MLAKIGIIVIKTAWIILKYMIYRSARIHLSWKTVKKRDERKIVI